MNITIKPNEELKLTHSITVDISFDIPITASDAREWVLNALNHYMDAEGKCPDMEDYTEKVITEPEPEPAAVVKSKKIDWNKACALKEAGWSNEEIAREVGGTKSTIATCIVEKMSLYKTGHRF